MTLYEQGDELYFQQMYAEAYSVFLEAIQFDQTDTDSMNYIGCCELMLGNYHEAVNWFDKVIRLEPHWGRPVCNKGRVFLKQGKYEDAHSMLQRSLVLDPDNEDTLFYLGYYYEQIEDLPAAEDAYRRSLEFDEEQSETLHNLGYVLFRMNRLDEAIEALKKSLAIDPDNTDVRLILRDIYRKRETE